MMNANINIQITPEDGEVLSLEQTSPNKKEPAITMESKNAFSSRKDARVRLGGKNDVIVKKWLDVQKNQTQSAKLLVERFVAEHGMKDVVEEMTQTKQTAIDTAALEQAMQELARLQNAVKALLPNS